MAHTEEEFIYILEGRPTLVMDEEQTVMEPGDIAGFKGGATSGRHLVNRSDAVAKLLVVGSRKPDDDVFYSDIESREDRE